jgi:hypothetical protein
VGVDFLKHRDEEILATDLRKENSGGRTQNTEKGQVRRRKI